MSALVCSLLKKHSFFSKLFTLLQRMRKDSLV